MKVSRPRTGAGGLFVLAIVAPLAGCGAGLVGALFRLTLIVADRVRDTLILSLRGWSVGGLIVVVALVAVAAAIAAWLVRRFAPAASGSGIPQVEAALSQEMEPGPPSLLGVKFLGGALAIGGGLALGREGPSIQMGAVILHEAGRLLRRSGAQCRVLLAAGAGAGLATAFNAPLSGAVFVLEELLKRFDARTGIAALTASATAIWIERWILGNAPDFMVGHLAQPSFLEEPLFILFGATAGLAGVVYNRTLLTGLETADRLRTLPVELRAAIVGAGVGIVAWFGPSLVGGGDPLTQQALSGVGTLAVLPLMYLLRQGLIACSYAAGTPGGLFAPLLVLGAELGLWFGKLWALAVPDLGIQPQGFALVGMAALFTAIVRAPLTGIVLVTEMTANVTLLLPMIVACSAAMLVTTLLENPPIYDSLKERLFLEREHIDIAKG